MKKLLGTLVKDPDERLVGQIPKLIFEDHLEFSQFKFNKDFGGFMSTYYPDLVLGMNDSESQLVDFPLPYSIDYFKTYSEPLSEVKKVLKELQSSFSFICAIDEMLVLPDVLFPGSSSRMYFMANKEYRSLAQRNGGSSKSQFTPTKNNSIY